MPKRTDIHSILIIGSGPIVIGQGCEFDYSGVQACRALKEEGYRIVLINSNPATIMTDPEFADATYIEPITPEAVEKILAREAQGPVPIDAVLPTLGGQTGLNTAMACYDRGIFTKYNVKMIGANRDAIHRGEDRQVFKDLMIQIGLKVPRSGVVHNMEEARKVLADIGLPLIIRPAFTLGGTGGGIAYNVEEFETIVGRGLDASPVTEVLIEQSVIGWKEFEMEVMRDKNDNVVIICSIENLDPMGVHTGDSITVAPIQTLTDKEYQRMRDASIAVIRAVGVETGGSNIQFAINPDNGDMIVVEMNPRVSRSSALASKATGYPIAKLAAKLAVGYTLDELPNYITSRRKKVASGQLPVASKDKEDAGSATGNSSYDLYTSACFEPTIDYCVIKIPRWTFEKFPDADETLTTQMKSVGEAMAIGRTFKEALQKGIRSMEVKRFGFGLDKYDKWLNAQKQTEKQPSDTGFQPMPAASSASSTASHSGADPQHGLKTRVTGLPPTARAGAADTSASDQSDKTVQGESQDAQWPIPADKLRRKLAVPSQGRLYYIRYAMKMGWTNEEIHELTNIDPWFLGQMRELVDFEDVLLRCKPLAQSGDYEALHLNAYSRAKVLGYSDVQLSSIWNISPDQMRTWRKTTGPLPVYKLVDTCAAEFEAATPYYYSAYESGFRMYGDVVALQAQNPSGVIGKIYTRQSGSCDVLVVREDEIRLTNRPKVIIIGGGPNRIGQGIEFDYCCVQAAFAMRELGIESVMVNSNPETVSTDYDTSDLLFFEPLTHEDILNICERLNGGPFVDSEALSNSAAPAGKMIGIADVAKGVREARQTESVFVANFTNEQIRPEVVAQIDHKLIEGGGTRAAVMRTEAAGPFELVVHYVDAERSIWRDVFDTRTWTVHSSQRVEPAEAVPTFDLEAWRIAIRWHANFAAEPNASSPSAEPKHGNLVKGVIVQFGGQTPLNLARGLKEAGVPILGTTVESLDAAGDREQFRELLQKLGLKQPANGIARSVAEARKIAREIGYPVLVRPSFVLGGRAMEIVYGEDQLNYYMTHAVEASTIADAPILVDKFLDAATEVDVDCISDYDPEGNSQSAISNHQSAIVIGVMEHIEEAGIHSGDSACALPPYSLSPDIVKKLKDETKALAKALRVRGLMNVQYAIKDGEIYVIEVNPRASRTVPFVSKATGIPWAKIAAKVMAGKSLAELGAREQPAPAHTSVKESVFPFAKFPGVDVILGPEMRSTGEVMGIDQDFPLAFAKSQIAAGSVLPTSGTVFISVRDADKQAIVPVARMFADAGFEIIATDGTHKALSSHGVPSKRIAKLSEGRPNIGDYVKNRKVHLIINTPTKKGPQTDEGKIRAMSVLSKVPIVTTLTGANAAARAIQAMQKQEWGVKPLQAYFAAPGLTK